MSIVESTTNTQHHCTHLSNVPCTLSWSEDEWQKFEFSGSGHIYIYTFISNAQIEIYGSRVQVNNLQSWSDDRLKHDERDISNGLDVVRQLAPKSYIKDDIGEGGQVVLGNKKSAGFIAQEVQSLEETREFVSESNSGFLTLNYDAVFTYAVAAIKELDAVVQSQAKTILDLQQRIEDLENS